MASNGRRGYDGILTKPLRPGAILVEGRSNMNERIQSPRRRQLMIAGLAGSAVPRSLHFAPARGFERKTVAFLQRDDAGTWGTTFGLTLA
jgi:hypothetical protein